MIRLIDGMGQLGEELKKHEHLLDVAIYHTWSPWDKNNVQKQKECYLAFKKFIDEHRTERIIFVSTSSTNHNAYTFYKHEAEKLLLKNIGCVVRLPNIIGKGIFKKFKDNEAEPFDFIELLTIEEAANAVVDNLLSTNIVSIPGHIVPSHIVYNLIQFGKK